MALKYILVPEAMYKSFTHYEPDNINLDFERKQLEKIKNDKMDPALKNLKINQELQRYLRLKRENDNKPIKVEVTNGPKMLIKKPVIRRRTPSLNTVSSVSTLLTGEGEEEEQQDNELKFETPKTIKTRSTPFEEEIIDQRVQSLLDHIKKNPKTFGIDKLGRVLRPDGKPFQDSDLKQSILHIVLPGREHRTFSPAGTAVLKKRLRDDPTAQSIIYNLKTEQGGKGLKTIFKKPKLLTKRENIFKPKLWM
jgi:hypothetical protein